MLSNLLKASSITTRLLITSLLSFSLSIIAIIAPPHIFAADPPKQCDALEILVNDTVVTLTAKRCNSDGTYSLIIENQATQEVISANQIMINGGASTPVVISLQDPGQYEAIVRTHDTIVVSGTFEIQPQANPIPNPLQCGDPVIPNSPHCPASCPSRACGVNWYCLDSAASCPPSPTIPPAVWDICDQLEPGTKSQSNCRTCFQSNGIWTAVGCIPVEPEGMISTLTRIGLLAGGGISFIIILAGSFILSTSKGEPKKITEAKEMITSALIGLIFIIFSVSILQLIGVQILHIPGFGV